MIKSKNQPLISYIITIYNKEKYIKHVLEAVLSQTHNHKFEIILVNDGSTDKSLEIVKKFSKKDEKIFLFNQTNKGPPYACNLGLKYSRGKFIKFVDGDDILVPNATSNLINPFLKRSDLPILSFSRNIKTFKKLDNSLKEFFKNNKLSLYQNENNNYVYYKSFLERSLHVSNMNLSCTLFKKETIDSFGGCNKKIFCPDYFVELMMSSRGPFIESKNLIFFNPFEDKNRISQNETQILHDLNYALEEFFLLNEKLSNLYGKKSLKRAASRQLNYIKKYVWKEISFDVLFHYILASLKVIKVDKNNFSKTRLAFKNIKHPNGLKD